MLSTEGGRICPVCGSLVEPEIELVDYRIFECRDCGCRSSDARLRGAVVSFDPSCYFENPDLDRNDWEALLRRLEQQERDVRSLLDVGCASGAFLAFVGERWPNVRREGIELDPRRSAQARELNPQAQIHTGDVLKTLEEATGPFDLITLWDVFEHISAPVRLLEDLSGLLSPHGCIYIQTIHELSLIPTLGRLSYRLSGGHLTYAARRTHEPHHLVFFTRKGLEIAADKAALRICELSFDRLAHGRMDGNLIVTAATSLLLALENALGNGLFVNLMLEPRA